MKPIAVEVIKQLSTRYDKHGKLTLMAHADGYIMCRRPRATPFVMEFGAWLKLPEEPLP